jgi:hypothetical protein
MFLWSPKRYCPECHSRDVRRSVRWGIIETAILPLFLLRPFRCQRCDARFFGLFFAARIRRNDSEGLPPDEPDESSSGRRKSMAGRTHTGEGSGGAPKFGGEEGIAG